MKKEVKKIVAYWRMVIHTAWQFSEGKTNLRGAFITLLLTMIIFDGAVILGLIGILPDQMQVIAGDFSSELRVELVSKSIAVIVTLIIFLFALVYMPSKIHYGEVETIETLQQNISAQSDIKVTLDGLLRDKGQKVSIKVSNNNSHSPIRCQAFYKRIHEPDVIYTDLFDDTSLPIPVYKHNGALLWENKSDEIIIEAKRHAWIDIVKLYSPPKPMHFNPFNWDNQNDEKRYHVWVDIYARGLGEDTFKIFSYIGCVEIVHFDSDWALRIWECEERDDWRKEASNQTD